VTKGRDSGMPAARVAQAGLKNVIVEQRDFVPRGPSLNIRPRPEQCRAWGEETGLRWVRDQILPGSLWHWGMVLERPLPLL
jgi:hypothetical protein